MRSKKATGKLAPSGSPYPGVKPVYTLYDTTFKFYVMRVAGHSPRIDTTGNASDKVIKIPLLRGFTPQLSEASHGEAHLSYFGYQPGFEGYAQWNIKTTEVKTMVETRTGIRVVYLKVTYSLRSDSAAIYRLAYTADLVYV